MKNKESSGHALIRSLLYVLIALLIINGIFTFISFVYLVVNQGNTEHYIIGESTGDQTNNNCDDYDQCTRDIRLDDGTCIHRKYEKGHSCAEGEVCYNSSAPSKTCCGNGQCIANRQYCNGICPTAGFSSNASKCNTAMFPMNYQQFSAYTIYCIYGTCTLTVVYYYDELNALDDSYLFNISSCYKNINYTKSKCIQHECVLHPANVWVCSFRYRCSGFDYGNNLIDNSIPIITSVNTNNQDDNTTDTTTTIYSMPSFGQYIPSNIKNEMNAGYTKIVNELLKQASSSSSSSVKK